MMKIIKFKNKGGLRRTLSLLGGDHPDFWIEKGTIALQVGPVEEKDMGIWDVHLKHVVPLIMSNGTRAFAVCAPGGWGPWVEEL